MPKTAFRPIGGAGGPWLPAGDAMGLAASGTVGLGATAAGTAAGEVELGREAVRGQRRAVDGGRPRFRAPDPACRLPLRNAIRQMWRAGKKGKQITNAAPCHVNKCHLHNKVVGEQASECLLCCVVLFVFAGAHGIVLVLLVRHGTA